MVPSLLCNFVAHIILLHVFFLSPFPSLSLSLSLSHPLPLSLSPSPSLSLSMSLCGCKTRVIWCPLPNILFLINLTFHTLSLHSSYIIQQPFTDYLLRLPSSELLEKHIFRSRANRRLVPYMNLCIAALSPSRRCKCDKTAQRSMSRGGERPTARVACTDSPRCRLNSRRRGRTSGFFIFERLSTSNWSNRSIIWWGGRKVFKN